MNQGVMKGNLTLEIKMNSEQGNTARNTSTEEEIERKAKLEEAKRKALMFLFPAALKQ